MRAQCYVAFYNVIDSLADAFHEFHSSSKVTLFFYFSAFVIAIATMSVHFGVMQ